MMTKFSNFRKPSLKSTGGGRQGIISNKLANREPLFFIVEYHYIQDSDHILPWDHF